MTTIATLNSALTDRYELEREIGRGGMATVYLARDLKHGRHVAVKVLDPELGAVLGADRFLSEIRVTANLQHPNLLPLFDSGAAGGLLFYVMPFVEGESLRARLDREKQLPIDEAVRIATAIAAALDYAHRHGVIHRDLKPENVLLHDGQPLIADFGIALAVQHAGGQRVTQTGLSLGTPQYMSPEQATGDRAIDARTDIYALGAVTYEMLAGEPPHVGNTAQAIIAKLMTEEPRALTTVRRTVPEHVDDAVRCALEKLPADRFASAKEFADALAGRHAATNVVAARGARSRLPTSRLRSALASPLWFAAFLATAIGAALVAFRARPRAEDPRVVRFVLGADTTGVVPSTAFAFSPDGRTIVFKGKVGSDSVERLYARPLDAVAARPLPGTEGAFEPVFSPDGQWVAFWSEGDLKKIRLDGQQLITLARVGGPWGGISWGVQDRIVVAHEGQLRAVSEGGGTPTNITIKDTSSWAHLFPLALDDGKTVLYTEWHGSITNSSLNALSLQSGEVTRLGINGSTPLGILDGRLVYLDPGGNLATVNFDAGWRPSGEPTLVIPDVRSTSGQIQAAISRAGDLIYVGGRVQAQLVVADGDSVRTLVARPNAPLQFPRWSPDGRMIAVMSRLSGASEIWIYSLDARTFTQLTQLRSDDGVLFPEWTPDGKHVLYNVDRTLWSQAVGGGPPAKLVNLVDMRGFGVSPDGQTIVYRTGLEANRKLWYRSLAGDTTSHLLDTGPGAAEPRFSPDGKWIAWTGSDAAVYAARFPHLEDRVRISLEGGHDPVWSPDMRRVYYSAGPATVMVAHVSMAPRPVVTLREKVLEGTYVLGRNQPGFDVSRDGRIVLVRQQRDNGHTIVVQGWINELRGGL